MKVNHKTAPASIKAVRRLQTVIKASNLSVPGFSKQIGLKDGSRISKILRRGYPIPLDLAVLIHRAFPAYGVLWLVNGGMRLPEATLPDGGVVRLPVYADLERMPFPPTGDADSVLTLSASVAGNAQMAVAYANNVLNPYLRDSLLLLREVGPEEGILYGNIYLVVTEHFRLFRIVSKRNSRSAELRLTLNADSDNDIILGRDQIRSLWIVCGAVSRMLQ